MSKAEMVKILESIFGEMAVAAESFGNRFSVYRLEIDNAPGLGIKGSVITIDATIELEWLAGKILEGLDLPIENPVENPVQNIS